MLRLKELRTEKGLTQRQLAKIFNGSDGNFCSYEKGRIEPSIQMLIKLADYFQCTVDYLIGREDYNGNITIHNELTPIQQKFVGYLDKLNEDNQIRTLGYMTKLSMQQQGDYGK